MTLHMHRERTQTSRALFGAARALAAEGEIGDTVLARPGPALPAGLRDEVATLVWPPDPRVGYRVVPGLLEGTDEQGPTPTHWKDVDRHRTSAFDVALALVASLLGDVFGWVNQQDGRIVHNILPSPGYEEMQVGASSTARLAWHTEDAFHPDRADFLLLACVRNPDGVGSSLSTVNDIALPPADAALLSEPWLTVVPDDSYQDATADLRAAVGMSTLWDRAGLRCLRYDPAYTRMLTPDAGFAAAYDRLGSALDSGSRTVPLEPGDLLVIDNDVTVHGRVPFRARYDGTDRWLKRVLVRAPRPRPTAERREHGFGQVRVRASEVASGRRG